MNTCPLHTARRTISDVGMIGGDQEPLGREVLRVHDRVLCLNALWECKRRGLDLLRQLLDDGMVTSARMLVFASSPIGRNLPAYL